MPAIIISNFFKGAQQGASPVKVIIKKKGLQNNKLQQENLISKYTLITHFQPKTAKEGGPL